jgi:hypothetical protein
MKDAVMRPSSSEYLFPRLASHIPYRALVGSCKTYDRTLHMNFIITVTAVTKSSWYLPGLPYHRRTEEYVRVSL